jgi:molybdenum cofactor cytidylyltransferase
VFIAGLVLAAGGSRRLGRPKQLLPYRGATLLDATLRLARGCAFDQLLVSIGGAAQRVRSQVDLSGCEVVENEQFATGCASSISAAIAYLDPRADGVVLLLGDQPGVRADAVRRLVDAGAAAPLGVCRYTDGRGHPLWLGRDVVPDLLTLHGDKAVWKLLESGRHAVTEVEVDATVPLDVDTSDSYRTLLAADEAAIRP